MKKTGSSDALSRNEKSTTRYGDEPKNAKLLFDILLILSVLNSKEL